MRLKSVHITHTLRENMNMNSRHMLNSKAHYPFAYGPDFEN